MKTFFQSGMGFLLIALVFYVTAAVADEPAVFICLGAFWMILGIGIRARHAKASQAAKEAKP